jgi:hypothetical protein
VDVFSLSGDGMVGRRHVGRIVAALRPRLQGGAGPAFPDRIGGVSEPLDAGDDLGMVGAHGGCGAGGVHRFLDRRVEHGLLGTGMGYEVTPQKGDDVVESADSLAAVHFGEVVGGRTR